MLLLVISLGGAALGAQPETIEHLERRMVELINVERDARALPRLTPNRKLADVARSYSERMVETGRVNHDIDRPMEERIRDALPHTCMFGENVSKHTSVDYSLADLMTSDGHRANLLHDEYTTIGVGIVRGNDGFLYITQEFARSCEPRRLR